MTHSEHQRKSGQYLTHAQTHITGAVAAMDSVGWCSSVSLAFIYLFFYIFLSNIENEALTATTNNGVRNSITTTTTTTTSTKAIITAKSLIW